MSGGWIRKGTALLVLLLMSVIGGSLRAQPEHLMMTPTHLKWMDNPPTMMPGAKMAIMQGDPTKFGPYVYRLKIPADYKVMPHRHPVDEHLTVLSGTFYLAVGEKFDPEKGKQGFPVGSFLVMPAETAHFAWTKEETIVQVHGVGPSGITYVNPADDPRKR